MPASRNLTQLLPNDVLHRLERMQINAFRRFTNRSRGEHLAGRGGGSTDFADYRNYVAGDDTRFVDWNIFSRLQRPYLKVFRQEEEMHVVLLLDTSASMRFDGKFELARSAAAAFAVMGLCANERVSIYPFNAGPKHRLPTCRGRAAMARVFAYCEAMACADDQITLDTAIENMLRCHRGRGMVLIASDFLTPADLRRGFNLLYSRGLEVFGLQILSPAEIDPELTGDVRFVDCETGDTLDVTAAGELLELYREYRDNYAAQLSQFCRQRSGRFHATASDCPIHELLFDRLRREGWLR